jgi:uncharacterized protein YbaR (Trm112 family)
MTLDPEFLQMLVCPDSKKRLREVPAGVLAGLNAAIAAGGVTNRGGAKVTAPLAGALQPEGEQVVYPIQDDIPILLSGEAIPIQARP